MNPIPQQDQSTVEFYCPRCAQPVMDRYKIPATVRASFAVYNTRAEVDALARGIRKVQEVFA